ASITMDLNQVERIAFNALGGADTITVNDLTGTGVTQVEVNLAGILGGTAGDGAADKVVVNGTAANDQINVVGSGNSATVSGLAAQVTVDNAEATNDQLIINGLDGDDVINVNAQAGASLAMVVEGGAGTDTLRFNGGDVGNPVPLGSGETITIAAAG